MLESCRGRYGRHSRRFGTAIFVTARLFGTASLFSLAPVGCTRAAPEGASPGATLDGELGARLDQYLTRAESSGFSGVVLAARDGDIFLHKGYGLADRKRGTPVTVNTVFDIGSITKQFTAAAILKLQDRGELSVRDSLGRFFPGAPPKKRAITLHQLLTHTAGLPLYSGDDYELVSRETVLDRMWSAEFVHAPGERYEYSNPGFSILAAVVEQVSGEPWEEFVREQFWEPARMDNTGYVLRTWNRSHLARGYRGAEDWGTPIDHRWMSDGPSWNLRGNGGVLSTPGDLYRWHLALERGAILSDSALRVFCAPTVPATTSGSYYGFGCGSRESPPEKRYVGHSGGNGYFSSYFRRYPADRAVLVVSSNQAGTHLPEIVDRLAAMLVGGA